MTATGSAFISGITRIRTACLSAMTTGGWFWQKYTGGSGDWYQGSRHAAPAQGEEAAVHIEWTADHKMTLTLDGETVFENEDFSGIVDVLGTQIAFKCGS